MALLGGISKPILTKTDTKRGSQFCVERQNRATKRTQRLTLVHDPKHVRFVFLIFPTFDSTINQAAPKTTMIFYLMHSLFSQNVHPFPDPPCELLEKLPYMTGRKVAFDRVEIREHALILVDHPCCKDGMSLGLGWEHANKSIVYNIDAYERKKAGRPKFDRLDSVQRKERLKTVAGCKGRVLKKARKAAKKIRKLKKLGKR